ncbi:hypothetical protein [Methanoeremita antiquus]|nr:hypothetical protein [Methanomicrobium antiquum]MDD3977364.1 hypothetical protein [Methanomicrobium sp.]
MNSSVLVVQREKDIQNRVVALFRDKPDYECPLHAVMRRGGFS